MKGFSIFSFRKWPFQFIGLSLTFKVKNRRKISAKCKNRRKIGANFNHFKRFRNGNDYN